MMKKQIQEIKIVLESYFSTKVLPILDAYETGTKKEHYHGVTLPYIVKYVLKDKFPIDLVCYCLMDMLKEKEIRLMYCCSIHQKVFRSKYNTMWKTYTFDGNILNDAYPHCDITDVLVKNHKIINTKLQTETEMISA